MTNSFYDNQNNQIGGERVRVAIRIRPLMPHELQRNDKAIVSMPDATRIHLNLKTGPK